MKAIINCRVDSDFWSRRYFGRRNPFGMPILAKPLLEYYIDYCVLCGISDILVVQQDFDDDIKDFLGDGSKWGVKIFSSVGHENSVDELVSKNSGFVDDKPVMIMDGFFFPFYDKKYCVNADVSADAEKSGEDEFSDADDFKMEDVDSAEEKPEISIANISELDCKIPEFGISAIGFDELPAPCRPLKISSILEYFNLNMGLLRDHSDSLFMRGYCAQARAFLGMNDIIRTYASVLPPVVFGDNVQIESGATIGGNTIVGDTSVIDMRTIVKNSIVLSYTYIGSDLTLDSKIVCDNRIIDPINDVVFDTFDEHFTSSTSMFSMRNIIKRFFEIPCALIMLLPLMLIRIPFYLLGSPKKKKIWVRLPSGRSVRVFEYEYPEKWLDVWFYKLSLDRIPKLLSVITGKLSLIGDTVRDAKKDSILLERYKRYRAGAFTYADSMGHTDPTETVIDDLYYQHNRSFRTDLQLLFCSFPIRLFHARQKEDEV